MQKDLRSKFDADQKNAQAQKDVGKRQDKKRDIFTIARPRTGSESHKADENIEVLFINILNISFSIEDPRPPN